jgi:hypothetical protein
MFVRQWVYKSCQKLTPVSDGRSHVQEGADMGINRWSDIEERKRNETDAKAGDEVPNGKKGDASSRVEGSEGPVENQEKREVVEKLEKRERES